MPTVTTRERVNYCHACGAQPGQVCRAVTGRRSDDHAVRVHGIGPALPPSTVHVDSPVCRCLPCHNVRRREARAATHDARVAAHAARVAERSRQAAEAREARAAAAARAAAQRRARRRNLAEANRRREAAPAGLSTHRRTAAPCYRCGAGVRRVCRGSTGKARTQPHPERGRYGAWAYRPDRPDAALPERPLMARVIEAAQPDLLPTRRPARRTAA